MTTTLIELTGTYYDGKISQGRPATLSWHSDQLMLRYEDAVQDLSVAAARVQAQIGDTPRRITWGESASFSTFDQASADALTEVLPNAVNENWINRIEQKMSVALSALVLVAVLTGMFAVWGVPFIAQMVAQNLSPEISDKLGETTLSQIDSVLEPSEIPITERDRLATYLLAHGEVNRLEFRKAGRLGANAFTLSATTVVMTDELVALAQDDEELLAVYLHELGHAQEHHVERSILQNSAWLVLLALITGDATGASELVLTLPVAIGQMAYSRDFEREADTIAVQTMTMHGVSALKLATILERLEASHRGEDSDVRSDQEGEDHNSQSSQDVPSEGVGKVLFDYFSTHPATADRIEFIRDYEATIQSMRDFLQ